ncbi:hypothetical protein EUGRSUZ_K02092 [Eucalyptus grandis]|uniref:Uncharacterized protein n=3 Tax=Eucalyptus TaxID=3932 RepID=A0ACC3IVX7_EUCGR|nr:hypothetical protein EUGRSUZ_K02092 [Eucalyptus grandis]
MEKKDANGISVLSNSAIFVGWCRPRRRLRRRRGNTIRLGNKRRGFCLGTRPVVRWGVVASPFRVLKKIVMQIAWSGRLIDNSIWSLPILRPQLFPLC